MAEKVQMLPFSQGMHHGVALGDETDQSNSHVYRHTSIESAKETAHAKNVAKGKRLILLTTGKKLNQPVQNGTGRSTHHTGGTL